MLGRLYNKYWEYGFKTGWYDILTPLSYRQSIKEVTGKISTGLPRVWLDVGCGSGQLLDNFGERFQKGDIYWGLDRLISAIHSARHRVPKNGSVRFFQADIESDLPFKDGAIDVVAAHFTLYALSGRKSRARALMSLRRILKPGGILIVAESFGPL